MPLATLVPSLPTMPVTCKVPGVVSFTGGLRNGAIYTRADITELVDNFTKYSLGDDAYWKPYATVDHEETTQWAGLSLGDVVAARGVNVGGKPGLELDLERVPTPIGQLINSGQLRAVSVEWFDQDLAPFNGPDDKPILSKVLKCVTFIGSDSEASKGMPPPVAMFRDRPIPKPPACKFINPKPTIRFGDSAMDRSAMLAALATFGVDTAAVTDAVPDELLQALVTAFQAKVNPEPAQKMGDGKCDMTQKMGDLGAPAIAAPALAAPSAIAGVPPQSITLKFRDAVQTVRIDPNSGAGLQALFAKAGADYDQLHADLAALQKTESHRVNAARDQRVAAFRDEMTGNTGGKAAMTPVQFATIKPLLETCDSQTVRKFADGKATGTHLEEVMAGLRLSFPAVKRFGDHLQDPLKGNSDAKMSPDRRRELLSKTPEGEAVLRREKALAAAK